MPEHRAGGFLAIRACLVYDCLYPYTVGGAERWYRNLAERLAKDGHEVSVLTMRQWPRDSPPEIPGVRVHAVGPRMALYTGGRRRILPAVVFGLGVLWHLAIHGRRYDAVHSAATPFFSPLAAGLMGRIHPFAIVIDWHEVWSRAYWREYIGRRGGDVGWLMQRACVRLRHRAFCFARVHADRLRTEGLRGEPTILTGEYAGSLEKPEFRPADPVVVFVGRHIPEKQVPALVGAMARLSSELPEIHCDIYGDGPERHEVERLVVEEHLERTVIVHGLVDEATIDEALRRAVCMVLPSRREGYGLVVVEAAARGTPSVVVRDPDNAAVELVDDGVNGVIAESAAAEDLANAIGRVVRAGPGLRRSTADWFERNAQRLSLESSLDAVAEAYSARASAVRR